tara:strand:+ start:462 stop:581 length:120 start_codon:yes stop_codon:yes gene_type:complete
MIVNETFEAYRLEQKKIQDAVLLLKDKGYKVYKEDEQTS